MSKISKSSKTSNRKSSSNNMSTNSKTSNSKSSKKSKDPKSKDPPVVKKAPAGKAKAPPPKAPEPETVRVSNIIKPDNDQREYRALILPNQLRVLLISDPTTDKAAAAMSVQAGSLSDPWNRQGLAHLLEHCLFLSSKKYPADNFLKNYITDRGGTVNANTLLTDTVFFFDIAPAFLQNVLDRFSSLFLSPLFPSDKVERELDALQSEFQDRFSDDVRRCERVRQLLGNQSHVYAKFDLGNKVTLVADETLLKDVINFYKCHYSANVMGLAVLGKESLDTLEKYVTGMFKHLPNKSVDSPLHSEHPYSDGYCRKVVKIVPYADIRRLILFFPLPYTMRSNALDYIIWLLTHEGPGGLLAELKSRGLCTSIHVHSPYHHGFAFLDIELDLTQGVTGNDEIISTVFQYFALLKTRPQKETYDEIKAIKDIKFHYRDKVEPINYVFNLCFNLHVSLERCVLGRAFPDFVAEDIQYILDRLTPKTLNIQVVSPIFKEDLNDFTTDPIYGIQYSASPINQEQLDAWANVQLNPRLTLPTDNHLIPRNFYFKPQAQDSTQKEAQSQFSSPSADIPVLISPSNEPVRLWHLHDSAYRIPKAFYGIFFRSPALHASPLNLNLVSLYIKLYNDHVNTAYYSGRLVANSYSLVANKFGLELFVYGFNDCLESYALSLLNELLTFRIDPGRYEILRDIQENQLKGFSTWSSKGQLNFLLDMLINSNAWGYDELLASYGEVSPEEMQHLLSCILTHCQVEILAYGNVSRAEGMDFRQKVTDLLRPTCFKEGGAPMNPLIMLAVNRDVQLPTDTVYEFTVENDEQENHGILVFYQVGLEDQPLKARLELFHQLVYAAFFQQLRQTEQLAYVLALSFKYTYSGTIGIYAMLQSAYPIEYVESRVASFMNQNVDSILRNLTAEQLEKAKKSLLTRLLETPKRLNWMASRHWGEITSGQYRFNRNGELAEYVKAIPDAETMYQFYCDYFKDGGVNCRRLIIVLKSSKCKELTPKEEEGTKKETKKTEVQPAQESVSVPGRPKEEEKTKNGELKKEEEEAKKRETPPDEKSGSVPGTHTTNLQSTTASQEPPTSDEPPKTTPSAIFTNPHAEPPAPAVSASNAGSPSTALPTATQTQSAHAPPPPTRKRITSKWKFKCHTNHWPIPAIILDNF